MRGCWGIEGMEGLLHPTPLRVLSLCVPKLSFVAWVCEVGLLPWKGVNCLRFGTQSQNTSAPHSVFTCVNNDHHANLGSLNQISIHIGIVPALVFAEISCTSQKKMHKNNAKAICLFWWTMNLNIFLWTRENMIWKKNCTPSLKLQLCSNSACRASPLSKFRAHFPSPDLLEFFFRARLLFGLVVSEKLKTGVCVHVKIIWKSEITKKRIVRRRDSCIQKPQGDHTTASQEGFFLRKKRDY